MRVKAKNWLKYDGQWRKTGEVFEISTADADELDGMIEAAETPLINSNTEAAETEQPKRRGRPKQTNNE